MMFNADFFDKSSLEWRKNKKKLPNGCFQYICGAKTKKNTICQNKTKGACRCHIHKFLQDY